MASPWQAVRCTLQKSFWAYLSPSRASQSPKRKAATNQQARKPLAEREATPRVRSTQSRAKCSTLYGKSNPRLVLNLNGCATQYGKLSQSYSARSKSKRSQRTSGFPSPSKPAQRSNTYVLWRAWREAPTLCVSLRSAGTDSANGRRHSGQSFRPQRT